MKQINKLLIANRGEIALRIMRTCELMGIHTVAVHSEEDSEALFVDFANETVLLEGDSLQETYLNIEKIIQIATEKEVDGIHPGYGFLSENARFAEACRNANLLFVGPSAKAIELMGDKVASRRFAEEHGIPLLKGITGTHQELLAKKNELTFPVMIKASAGGGGKGMRIVYKPAELETAIEATAREAMNYFGNDEVFIERYIENPRHIEVQVLGDQHGTMLHLFERECTIQRRHQKIIEEAPSVTLNEQQRQEITQAAINLAIAADYVSAGTVEFIVDEDLNFYFMEMNTRIQVEHPTTEHITGIDLVEQQIRIAEGAELAVQQTDIVKEGHALECRIYAEDPANDFRPSPGEITYYHAPKKKFLRIDAALIKPQTVSGSYDPMIAKLITWGDNRDEAIDKMIQSLDEYVIEGIPTNIDYLKAILSDNLYQNNEITTNYCKEFTDKLIEERKHEREEIHPHIPVLSALVYDLLEEETTKESVWEQIGYFRVNPVIPLNCDDEEYSVHITKMNTALEGSVNDEPFSVTNIGVDKHRLYYSFNNLEVEVDVHAVTVNRFLVVVEGHIFTVFRKDVLDDSKNYRKAALQEVSGDAVSSPIPGTVVKVLTKEGQEVEANAPMVIVEAMKMENTLSAPRKGTIESVNVKNGDKVKAGQLLIELEKE